MRVRSGRVLRSRGRERWGVRGKGLRAKRAPSRLSATFKSANALPEDKQTCQTTNAKDIQPGRVLSTLPPTPHPKQSQIDEVAPPRAAARAAAATAQSRKSSKDFVLADVVNVSREGHARRQHSETYQKYKQEEEEPDDAVDIEAVASCLPCQPALPACPASSSCFWGPDDISFNAASATVFVYDADSG